MTLNIAILGAGRIGQVHARAVGGNRDARLVAVADAMPEAAQALSAAYGARVDTIDAIARDPGVDAVVICTPTDTHADLIEQFARAGKAIFCEKPIDLDIGRVKQCLKVVADTGTVLMVGFNRRFDPHFRALKGAIDAGRVGRVEQVVITSRDPAPPPHAYIERSGGIFRDMMIHDFDMARFLLGEPIARVAAVASALVDPGIGRLGDYDTAIVTMEAESGAQIVITNSRRASYGYDQRIEVAGSLGMAQAENQRAADIVVADASGFAKPVLLDFFMTRYLEAYAAEIAAFIAAVTEGIPPEVTGADGLAALELADAAARAAKSGSWVSL
ncbi:inositol 2-dehydrogenase [Palleronia sp. KMU-117]|uniref:inositol 2-dehydrogenase n=1 Tax=Palleronia sp. KMU-117 TaxID=3434108 RepID=UPI003D76454E